MSDNILRKLSIHLDWQTVFDGSVPANCFTRGHARGKRLRAKLTGPQVYRWLVRDAEENIVALYIRETGRLQSRLALYRNGHKRPKDTVNYIKECFEKAVCDGHKVELQLLSLEPLTINGAPVNMQRLSDPAVRKMLENIVILEAKAQQIKVLNRDEDSNLKMVRSEIKKLSSAELASLTERYSSSEIDGSELA